MKRACGNIKGADSFRDRFYRQFEETGLISSYVKMLETDLHILAAEKVEDEALPLVIQVRREIEEYVSKNPKFAESLVPLPQDSTAGENIQKMLHAGLEANVGPMAAVAGTIAEHVGMGLQRKGFKDLIVENGGDIYLARDRACNVSIFAGKSPLSGKIGLKIDESMMPLGICCSSATVGHSLSLGAADAVVVTAKATALADACATRIGNEVTGEAISINRGLDVAKGISGIQGVLIVKGQQLGAWGEVEIVQV